MSGVYRPPRRTRVYDCNYNHGENYYKPTLDSLDRKHNTAPSVIDRIAAAHGHAKPEVEDDLFNARRRANKVISEDSIFDVRSGKLARPMAHIEDGFDEQVHPIKGSLDRIRANKHYEDMMDDLDIEDTIKSCKRKARIDFGDKLDSMDDDYLTANTCRRGVKAMQRTENIVHTKSVQPWTSESTHEVISAASHRARASQSRLDDLETEMFERSAKQAARDKRSVHLKKFLAENEFDSDQSSQALARISARADKKMISF